MRIGLNLLHALPEIGGVWNYIASLLAALGDLDRENTYVGFVTKSSESLIPDRPNFKKILVSLPSESRPRRVIYENTILQLLAYRAHIDCMHWFAGVQAVFNAAPGLVTVHDLQPFSNRSDFSWTKRTYLRHMMARTSKRAALLLPISNATSAAMRRQFGTDEARMIVIPFPLNERFKRATNHEIQAFRKQHRLTSDFWLYVAHTYPHKNHVKLLTAYHQLKLANRNQWRLVLRGDDKGAKTDVLQSISQLGLQDDVILLPRLADQELPALYSAASALVFPSLHEGLGIPIIEAMACGCPVAASKIPAVREVAGDVPVYFDPTDVQGMASAMWMIQSDEEKRAGSRQLGFIQAGHFRASDIVSKLLDAYRYAATMVSSVRTK